MAAKKRKARLAGIDDWRRHFGCSSGSEGYHHRSGSREGYVCKIKPRTPRSMEWEWTVFDDARRDKRGIAKTLGKGRAWNALIAIMRADAKMK